MLFWLIIIGLFLVLLFVLFHTYAQPPKDDKRHKHLRSPLLLVYVNALGRIWKSLGFDFALVRASKESMLKKAQRETGLTDFGDNFWEEPLNIVLSKQYQDTTLSLLGVFYTRFYIHRYLSDRLLIVEEFKKTPSLSNIQLPRPLFITGLPRTGTTLLFNLLAQDPLRRSPQMWELFWPTMTEKDARAACKRDVDLIHWVRPNLESIHHLEEENPEECLLIFAKVFMDLLLVSSKSIKEYEDWWWATDIKPFYAFHKQYLQFLSSRFSKKTSWTLKAPFHLAFLDTLLQEYPDACIVHTHRKLKSTMGSLCSLNTNYSLFFEEKVDIDQTSTNSVNYWSKAVNRSFDYRSSLPKEQEKRTFFDVDYCELTKDPIAVIESLYQHFGFVVTSEFKDGMKQWLLNNPPGKHGAHEYTLDFSLDDQVIDSAFAEYKRKYNV